MVKWLRNKAQCERYDCTTRTLERMRKDGRLPPSRYPFSNKIPANTEAELDAHDAAVIKHGPQQRRRDGAAARAQHQAAE